jgi:hypothetical protein
MADLPVRPRHAHDFLGPKSLLVEVDRFRGVADDEIRRGSLVARRNWLHFGTHGSSYELGTSIRKIGLQSTCRVPRGDRTGIMVFHCSNLTDPAPPPGTQPCPAPSGTVRGTFSAADVIGPEGQGISAGEFDEAIRALLPGSDLRERSLVDAPRGEIRGQIRSRD